MSNVNLMLGNCLERMKEIHDCSVAMILTVLLLVFNFGGVYE